MQGWGFPRLGSQGAQCKLGSLTSPALPPLSRRQRESRSREQHNRGIVGLWIAGRKCTWLVGQPVRLGFLVVGFYSLLCGLWVGFREDVCEVA